MSIPGYVSPELQELVHLMYCSTPVVESLSRAWHPIFAAQEAAAVASRLVLGAPDGRFAITGVWKMGCLGS